MNMGSFANAALTNLNAPAPAPAAPHKAAEPAAEKPAAKEQDFGKALDKEMHRQQGVPLPLPLPWLPNQAQQVPSDEDEAGIEAAGAVAQAGVGQAAWLRAAMPLAAPTGRAVDATDDEPFEVAPVKARDEKPTSEVQVVVEAGLPPVQPLETVKGEAQPVHVADFPQVVTGTVQQMVKDNQPVTQLDFEISPPHIGPVNLQVTLENGAVNVQLVALTMQAKQALDHQVSSISQILQAHQFTPGQIKVVTAAGGKAGAGSAGQKGEQGGFNFFSGGRKRSAAEQESMSVGRA